MKQILTRLALTLAALVFALVLALPAGILAAMRRGAGSISCF
jgi:ABC-type dipeptide/oligopeptide/nickel transport system permease component